MLKNKTDSELIDLVKLNNPEAFAIIYDRYIKFVYNKCFDFFKNKQQAEDITHDIFIKIHQKIGSYSNQNFLGWISRFTYNACIDTYRKQNKQLFESYSTKIYNEDLTEEISDEELFKVKYDALVKILDEINVLDKEIILLKYREEKSIKEISYLLNLSNSAVKMKINRAKKKIVELYKTKYQPKVN